MSAVRFNVPDFIAEKCTGCAKCWTQCPDSAIPGVVNTVEEVLEAAVHNSFFTAKALVTIFPDSSSILAKNHARSSPAALSRPMRTVLSQAYETVAGTSPIGMSSAALRSMPNTTWFTPP